MAAIPFWKRQIIFGTRGDDTLTGGDGVDVIFGRAGDDVIFGAGGNDLLFGGRGSDTLDGGLGHDLLVGGHGADTLKGGDGNDILLADGGSDGDSDGGSDGGSDDDEDGVRHVMPDDLLDGGAGDDLIRAGAGMDTVIGGAGNDRVYAGSGDDRAVYRLSDNLGATDLYHGGSGTDTLHLVLSLDQALDPAVQADLAAYASFLGSQPAGGSDDDDDEDSATFKFTAFGLEARSFEALNVSVEGVVPGNAVVQAGTPGNDTLIGTDGSDMLMGGEGDDTLEGGLDNDALIGGDGDDHLEGGPGDDLLYPGDGEDLADGGDGNDLIVGGKGGGDDTYKGGRGIDTADYKSTTQGVDVDLKKGTAKGPEIGYDRLYSIENVIGGAGRDRLIGSADANVLMGREGNDQLFGAGGDDVLDGGAGLDVVGFDGSLFDYGFSQSGPNWIVTDNAPGTDGNEATDTLSNVEAMKFRDGAIYLDGRNNAPFTRPDGLATDEDTALAFTAADLVGNDFDFENSLTGAPLAVTAFDTGATLGTVTDHGGGTYRYDAGPALQYLAVGETATDTFTYTVSDGHGGTDTATVSVTVDGRNDAPSAVDDYLFGGAQDLDVFVANYGGQDQSNRVWLNDGTGGFSDSGQALGSSSSFDVKLGDVDGDGDLDALVMNDHAGHRFWLNDGAGVFTDSGKWLGSLNSQDVELGDFDGDGDLDAFEATVGANRVWLNHGAAHFAVSDWMGSFSSRDVELGDIDGDGDLDAVVANGIDENDAFGTNRIWLNDGTGYYFTQSPHTLGSSDSYDVELGDLDGDGDLDALVADWHVNRIWLNDGTGNFSDSGQFQGSSYHPDVELGDLDGDGDLDAWVASDGSDRIWLNDGAGTFTEGSQVPDSSPGHDIELGDLDGDGDLDAVLANGSVWLNDGAGTFTDGGQSLGSVWSLGVALGDLDGDGGADEDTPFTIAAADVLANDTDIDTSDILSISAVAATSSRGASVRLHANGNVVYDATGATTLQTLAVGETATDTFTYTVTDGHGGTDTAQVTLTVAGRNDKPVAHADAVVADEDTSTTFTAASLLANDTDVDGDALTIAWAGSAENGNVALDGNGNVVFVPATNYSGPATFAYTVSDGLLSSETATVTVAVNPVADAPTLSLPAVTVDQNRTDPVNGPEFQVNTTTAHQQIVPSVTVLTDGSFVVIWESVHQRYDGSWGDIYGQHYAANGTPIGTVEFPINTYAAGSQALPHVAALTDGGFVAIWSSDRQDGDGRGIFGQLFDANCETVGTEFPVNTHTASHQDPYSVTGLADGGFVVAWNSWYQDGSSSGVYAQRFDAAGNKVGAEFRANTTTDSYQGMPSVAPLSDGGFVVTWQTYDWPSNNYDIRAQIYRSDGTAAGPELPINTTTDGWQQYPSVAALSDGSFVVTWQSYRPSPYFTDIFAQRVDADGNLVGTEFQVNSYTQFEQQQSAVTGLADGGFVVTWSSGRQAVDTDEGVYGQRYDANGDKVGTEFRINETTPFSQRYPVVDALPQGGFVAAWQSRVRDTDTNLMTDEVFARMLGIPGPTETPLDITATLADTDGSETLSVLTIAGVPDGASLSAGTDNGGGTWTLTPDDLANLVLRVPGSFVGEITLTVTATAIEQATGETAATSGDLIVKVLGPLFTGGDDTVDFNTIGTGEYIEDTYYDALDGNDTVTLADDPAAAGYDPLRTFHGGAGNDVIIGSWESDRMAGDAGNDILDGGSGYDIVDGGEGADILIGGLYPGSGGTLDGGPGIDTVSYGAHSPFFLEEFDVDLLLGTTRERRTGLVIDTLDNIENVIGGHDDDLIRGDIGDNVIEAGDGDDWVFGEPGNDTIYGNWGIDRLEGGADSDTYVFRVGDSLDEVFDIGTADDIDRLRFEGIAGTDLSLSRSVRDLDDLVVSYGGIDDRVTVYDQFQASSHNDGVEKIEAGGVVYDFQVGTDGGDRLTGGTNPDLLFGGAGLDWLYGDAGDDILRGGDGHDWLFGEAGNDVLDGGAGIDKAGFHRSNVDDVIVDLAAGTATGVGIGSDTLIDIETVFGGAGNDDITGDRFSNTLGGGAGNDILRGAGGGDSLHGSAGSDTYVFAVGDGLDTVYEIDEAAAIDTLSFEGIAATDLNLSIEGSDLFVDYGTDDRVRAQDRGFGITVEKIEAGGVVYDFQVGTDGGDRLTGGTNPDLLFGGAGLDWLYGDAGDDILRGGDGHDWLFGEAGNDVLDGGAGIDKAGFHRSNVDDVIVDLAAGTATGIGIGSDTLIDIETVFGGAGNDDITGDRFSNTLSGGAGNDILRGAGGGDSLHGSAGSDTYVFAVGDGLDTVYEIDEAAAIDTLSFEGIAATDLNLSIEGSDLFVDYGTDDRVRAQDRGFGITVEKIEAGGVVYDFQVGTDGGDRLTGGTNPDLLFGGAGLDWLYGDAGDDTLRGGDGHDWLFGEAGNDVLDGGAGIDKAGFHRSNVDDVIVDLAAGTATGIGIGSDTLIDIETVFGGAGNDDITGDRFSNTLSGGAGNDILRGAGGGDSLHGSAGSDTYVFAVGDGLDTVYEIDEAAAIDTLSFEGIAATDLNLSIEGSDLFVDYGTDDRVRAQDRGFGITVEKIEAGGVVYDFQVGTDGNDFLTGGTNPDLLFGGAGVDTAVFGGDWREYTVTALAGGRVTVTDTVPGRDGMDHLAGIEQARFADGTFFLDGTNNAPTAVDDAAATDEDTTLFLPTDSLLGNDTDFDGDTLTLAAVDHARHGTVTLKAGGAVFSPDIHFSGTASFDYAVTDGRKGVAWATVTIAVNPAADAPTLRVRDVKTDPDTLAPLEIRAELVDSDTSEVLSVTIADVPLGAVLTAGISDGAGTWTLTPEELFGLHVDMPRDSVGDNLLKVTATATEKANGDVASTIETLIVTVPPQPLFTIEDDVVDFNTLTADYYVDGTQYDAMNGNDVVTLPLNAAAAQAAGYDLLRTFRGGDGYDVITGSDGPDTIDGGPDDDELAGGRGEDVLYGGEGSDTYIFSPGDEPDTVIDTGSSLDKDTLQVGNIGHISAVKIGFDWEFYDRDFYLGANVATIVDQFNPHSYDSGIEELVVDGDVIDLTHDGFVEGLASTGATLRFCGGGDDIVFPSFVQPIDADHIFGGSGNDVLNGNDWNNILAGGGDNDELEGGLGNDTYLFFFGDGVDTVFDRGSSSETDTLRFYSVHASDLNLSRTTSDDLFIDDGFGTEVTVLDQFDPSTAGAVGVEKIDASGDVYDFQVGTDAVETLTGGTGDDLLHAGGGGDTLEGGWGNDVLAGGTGSDIFVFADGDGDDVITDFEVGIDTLALAGGFDAAAPLREQDVNDDGIMDTLVLFASGDTVGLLGVTGLTDEYDLIL